MASCHHALGSHAARLRDADVLLLAYLTDISRDWLLGLSASAYRIPLVLVGQGNKWVGARGKMWGVARAAQLLGAVAPHVPILVLDGADTFVANPLRAIELARAIGRADDRVVVSTECNLWPVCTRMANFSRTRQHAACRNGSWPACFPNSGAFLGSGRALSRLVAAILPAFDPAHAASNAGQRAGGKWASNDQFAIGEAYLEQAALGLEIELDGRGDFVTSLIDCRPHRSLRAQNCWHEPWDALRHLRVDEASHEATLKWRTAARGGGHGGGEERAQRPLVLHSNADPTFAKLNSSSARPAWTWLLARRDELLAHPVVSLDGAALGACNVSSLGDVLALGHDVFGRMWSVEHRELLHRLSDTAVALSPEGSIRA